AVLLSGIWGLYSLDRLFEEDAPPWLRGALTAGFLAASASALWWLRRLPMGTDALVAALAAMGFAYRRLKRVPLVKSFLVPAVWLWAGIALTRADGSWFGWRA